MGEERIGDRIRAQRTERGWTQAELAQRSGLSWGFVRQLETHRRPKPSMETLTQLADAFGISIDALVRGEAMRDRVAEAPADLLVQAGFTEAEVAGLVADWPNLSFVFRVALWADARRLYAEHEKHQAEQQRLQAQREAFAATLRRRKQHPSMPGNGEGSKA